jgi:adenosylcobyric acid synthase
VLFRSVSGYEIHMGETVSSTPWLEIETRNGAAVHVADGAASPDGRVWGCYLHGLFGNRDFRRAWLRNLGWMTAKSEPASLDLSINRLADVVESSLEMAALEKTIWAN